MKKFLNIVLIISVTLFYLTAFCFENMKRNSVYYAKHTPHKEGTEPVLMMLGDNLEWIYTPEIEGIKYKFRGGNIVSKFNDKGQETDVFYRSSNEDYSYSDLSEISYTFDKSFKLEDGFTRECKYIEPKDIDVDELKSKIYVMLKPIIDAQSKPRVNLQWLFDIVYKDKFN